MTRKVLAAAIVLAGLLAVPQSTLAVGPDVVAPGSTYAGSTYAQLSAAWWQWSIAQPAAHHPLSGAIDDHGTADPLARCDQGQSGPVWFLGGVVNGGSTVTRDCTVPRGTALHFPVGNGECSDLEEAPFFGATASERRACAIDFIDTYLDKGSLRASVDGIAVPDLARYRVTSPDFGF